jgi:hypothetical protein
LKSEISLIFLGYAANGAAPGNVDARTASPITKIAALLLKPASSSHSRASNFQELH